jgi:hypothetical protein
VNLRNRPKPNVCDIPPSSINFHVRNIGQGEALKIIRGFNLTVVRLMTVHVIELDKVYSAVPRLD